MATVLAALALALLATLGIQRIKTDDSLSQLFRSEDPAFKQVEQVSRDFPSSEYDVLIVVRAASLLDRSSVEKLRSFRYRCAASRRDARRSLNVFRASSCA